MRAGVNSFQASRLTQARESLGLTKVALASLLDVSQATISNWENGRQFPEESKLQTISEKLNMPAHWFLREMPDHGEKAYFFRSMAAASKTARTIVQTKLDWMAEISQTLQQWLDWPAVSIKASEEPFLQLRDEDIERLADQTRDQLGLNRSPVPDVVLAMENAGIICARDVVGFSSMDGVSHWSKLDNRPYVFLSNDKNNGIRSRFDVSHELGHIVLHKNVSAEVQKEYHKEIERQADLFAGCFLMPAESFSKDIPGIPTLDNLLAIKPRWKVSVGAMIMRCYQLNLINDEQKLNLYKRLSSRKWRTKEPYDDKVPLESGRLLPRAINMLVEHKVTTKEALLDELGLPPAICEGLCGLPEGFFMPSAALYDNLVQLKTKTGTSRSSTPAKVVSFPTR